MQDEQEPEPKVLKTSPCIICLGVLQDDFLKDGLDEVSFLFLKCFHLEFL